MDVSVLWVTLKLAFCTTGILAVVGIPLAWWLVSHRRPWTRVVEALVALPLVLPPTVLGFYLLLWTAPDGGAGRVWSALMGRTLPFSFEGILLGSVVANIPFAVRPFVAAFEKVERRWVLTAWTLGASPWRTFFTVTLPLAAPGIRAGLLMTWAHTLGEFGVVLMLGGNIPGHTRTVSVAIFDAVQAMDHSAAHQASALLLLLALGVSWFTTSTRTPPP